MANFRENVIDVLEEWGFYDSTLECGQPAFNSGTVQIKCFINNVCPFYKTPYKEDSIVFNHKTVAQFKDILTEGLKKQEDVE